MPGKKPVKRLKKSKKMKAIKSLSRTHVPQPEPV
jgi:hypothetical protein